MLFNPYAYDLTTSAQRIPLPDAALAADALLEVPQEACRLLWQGLTAAVDGTLDLWDSTPPSVKREPPVLAVQHVGQPRFNPAHLRRQTLPNWHRTTGLDLRLAAEALEALIQEDTADHREMLAEQCTRVGQLYSEMKRRGGTWMAQALLGWELRMLRYRTSPVLVSLIYQ